MISINRAWAALLLVLALPASAEIYSYIDEQGNRVFTDRPGGRAVETIKSRPTNSMPAVETQRRPSAQPAAPEPDAIRYRLLEIGHPAPDATIRSNAGNLEVSATSDPALDPAHAFRLLLDGKPFGETVRTPQFSLSNIDRGTHQLVVEIVDASGNPLKASPPHTFHLHRTSLAQRRRVRPCVTADYGVRPECPLADKPVEKKDIPFVPFL
ncbi:DUF4124 domain-containing protein [Stutzerimonas marianensis]|uniref:DUF4124 domain-containing protein n=1 Tax=Stutzerimonas marianensis TaxID=2929513 RepID=UPI003C2FF8D1